MALFSVSVHEYTCYLWLDIVEDILYWWSLIFFPQVSSWTYWVEISLSGLWLYPSVHPLSPPSNNLLTCEWHWSMGHCHEAMMNWIIYTRICLPSCFQSNGKSNHVTLKKVQPFSLWPLMGSVRSRPWQDPMSDPKNSSQACPWPKSGPFFPFPRQSPLSTEPLRSTKTTQLGNKNAEGQKDGWGWMGGGGGGSKQITFDPMLVNGYLTGSMLWGVYGLWLSGPVCTKVMCLLKRPMNWQLFLALCGVAQGPKTLISLGRDGKEKSYTLKPHTGFCRC